ncbi:MAG: PD-(D/E)XK nuclease family protein [Pyrinomonadaceae bacterium]
MSRSEKAINTSEKRSLAEFLVGNSELEELSAKLNQFNILQVLRIERAEIRHSNVLGWLLNPRESHGLSETFVRRFISTLLLDNEQADFDLSSATVELMDLVDVEVRREWRNIDLLIHSKANHLVILIENKIRAKESKGQLLKYKGIVQQSFPDTKIIIPVLLTLEGDEPSEMAQGLGYIPWSHVALYKVATEVIEQQQNRIPQDAQTFLRHYLSTLRKEAMQDKELEDLCKSIYRKHKAAIDLIVRYGAATAFGEAAEDFIREHGEIEQIKSMARRLWFIPKKWASVMPREIKGWESPYPVAVWFRLDQQNQKVHIKLEIGPVADAEQRRKLVEAFRRSGFKIPTLADREGARYTRFYSRARVVNEIDDSNEVKQAMVELWQQSADKVNEATKVIENFIWEEQ